jgi:3-oxoacyl-[acyl-carrier protein] reductase
MNIIITGTSRGIGLELVKLLGSECRHKIISLSRSMVPNTYATSKENIKHLPFDINDLHNFDKLASVINDFFDGKTDILINNAGSLISKPFEQLTVSDFDQMFNINIKGVFLLIQRLLPYFNRPAHIVNIGSMGGYQGSVKFSGLSLYAASKGALAILSECLAEEFKPRDISVNTLALGAVDTDMLKSAFPGYKAHVSASGMAEYISGFALNGHKNFNGKILPVTLSTP